MLDPISDSDGNDTRSACLNDDFLGDDFLGDDFLGDDFLGDDFLGDDFNILRPIGPSFLTHRPVFGFITLSGGHDDFFGDLFPINSLPTFPVLDTHLFVTVFIILSDAHGLTIFNL